MTSGPWHDPSRWPSYLASAAFAGFAAAGLHVLFEIAADWLAGIVLGALLCVVGLRVKGVVPFRLLGGLVVAIIVLVGAEWLWAVGVRTVPDPYVGLLVSACIVATAMWLFVRPWWQKDASIHPVRWAIAAGLLVVLLPFALYVYAYLNWKPAGEQAQPVSELDVVTISTDPNPARPRETIAGWRVRHVTGRLRDDRVTWSGREQPPLRDGADRVVFLLADGDVSLPPPAKPVKSRRGTVSRLLATAERVGGTDAPTFALLRSGGRERIARWRALLAGREGDALVSDRPLARAAIGNLALRRAILADSAEQDLSLAARHRPALFFSTGEPYARPLNVDRIVDSGTLRLCPDHQVLGARCAEIDGPEDLRNGDNHLEFVPREVADASPDTTIYVHVTQPDPRAPRLTYLDYWWYLPSNPIDSADGALCGKGFIVLPFTCFDHLSDWEGVTVVVDAKAAADAAPLQVIYAKHGKSERYTWAALRELWRDRPTSAFLEGEFGVTRPLVFVARGTHASYPTACTGTRCERERAPLKENQHDGLVAWSGNTLQGCRAVCVEAIPTRDRGRKAATWNAYSGRWGFRQCQLVVYCADSDAPTGPAAQERYREPTCSDQARTLRDGRLAAPQKQRDCTLAALR